MEFGAFCFDHGVSPFVHPLWHRVLKYTASRIFLPRGIFYPTFWHLPC